MRVFAVVAARRALLQGAVLGAAALVLAYSVVASPLGWDGAWSDEAGLTAAYARGLGSAVGSAPAPALWLALDLEPGACSAVLVDGRRAAAAPGARLRVPVRPGDIVAVVCRPGAPVALVDASPGMDAPGPARWIVPRSGEVVLPPVGLSDGRAIMR